MVVLCLGIQVRGLVTQVRGPALALTVVLSLENSHYIDAIISVSFGSDAKLADICSQMEFVPVVYSFERILAVPAAWPLLRGCSPRVG